MDSQTLLIIFYLLNQAFCKTSFRNVAINKPTGQSTSPQTHGDATHAVDNNTDSVFNHFSCTHTGDEAIEWWCVDLQHVYIINNIKLYNRDILQERLRGFTMKLSYTGQCSEAGFNSASPCYIDNSQQNHAVYNITECNQPSSTSLSGRFVFIQNQPNEVLNLCEVQVYKGGCPNGTFGEDCDKQCNINCKDRLCNSTTGTCNTCEPGFYNTTCQQTCTVTNCIGNCDRNTGKCSECNPGFHGTTCQKRCSNGCSNNNCNKDNGTCICKSGFTGNKCETCQQGKYGDDCQQDCSIGCLHNTCSRSDGTCPVCTSGWFDARCNSLCNITNCVGNCNKTTGRCSTCYPGWFGQNCGSKCNEGCIHDTCIKSDGSCSVCTVGWYGTNCASKCSGNCTRGCDKSNGICSRCKSNTVGQYCNSTCGSGCQPITGNLTCNRDGRCTRCIMGIYGDRCNKYCNITCNGGCDRYNGTCINGCIKGKSGEYCNKNCNDNCIHCKQDNINSCTECKDGRWGTSCHEICSFNCKPPDDSVISLCDQMTGSCSGGCQTGKTGTDCFKDNPKQSKYEGISPVVGGIIGALFGIAVTGLIGIIGFCYYIKRKLPRQPAREPSGYRYNNRPDTCVSPVLTRENTYDTLEQASNDHSDVADPYYKTLEQVPAYVNLGKE